MKQLYIKQKVMSLREKFTIKNEEERDVYFVQGSFMKIPKTFSISNMDGKEVALIKKKPFTLFLPKFYVEVEGQRIMTIKKELTFVKSRYTIDAHGIEVKGNWIDMNFEIIQKGTVVGQVSKAWFSWGDSYKVDIFDESMETVVISIVVAIDHVKKMDNATSSASVTP